jgi:Possible tRNA binding domain
VADFRRRLLSLLSFGFREFGSVTALSIVEAANAGAQTVDKSTARGLSSYLHPHLVLNQSRIGLCRVVDAHRSFRPQAP